MIRHTPTTYANELSICRIAGYLAILTVALTVCGCSKPQNDQDINAFVHDWEASVSEADYRLQPPDVIHISSAQAPEIDGEVQTIRQDGKVTLRLLGDVKVAGYTPVEVSGKLEMLLAKYYHDPKVNVCLARASSKRFYVFGQVAHPGPFIVSGRDTVLSALGESQPTFGAWKERIKLIRPSPQKDQQLTVTVDGKKLLQGGHLEQNVLLQEGDILYVPPTPLAWVGMHLQELVGPASSAQLLAGSPVTTATNVSNYRTIGNPNPTSP